MDRVNPPHPLCEPFIDLGCKTWEVAKFCKATKIGLKIIDIKRVETKNTAKSALINSRKTIQTTIIIQAIIFQLKSPETIKNRIIPLPIQTKSPRPLTLLKELQKPIKKVIIIKIKNPKINKIATPILQSIISIIAYELIYIKKIKV